MTSHGPAAGAMPCVLCGIPAQRECAGDEVHYLVHCECCGTFELSDAVFVMLETLPAQIREALCAVSIAHVQTGDRLRITLQNVSRLVAPFL